MKKQKVRGAKRMQALGYRQSQIWMTPQQYACIASAAEKTGLTVSAFILRAAARDADGVLGFAGN